MTLVVILTVRKDALEAFRAFELDVEVAPGLTVTGYRLDLD